jgi:hypothetical protein
MRDHLAGLDATHVSYSELNTLATCEQKWYENYVLRNVGPPSAAMRFGTVLHSMIEEWWGDDPFAGLPSPWEHAVKEEVDLYEDGKHSYEDAQWLMRRYDEVYEPWKAEGWHRAAWCTGELSLEADIVVDGIRYVVRVTPDDFLVDPDGKLVLVERKSMADWRRIELVDVTPQETIQTWAARENGYEIDRILFDAIKTYRWALVKPSQKALIQAAELASIDGSPLPWSPPFGDEPPEWAGIPQASKRKTAWAKAAVEEHPGVENYPPEASFQAVPVYRDGPQVDGVVIWVTEILRRRAQLHPDLLGGKLTSIAKPIRNISTQTCGGCPYQEPCWTELSFPPRTYVVEED